MRRFLAAIVAALIIVGVPITVAALAYGTGVMLRLWMTK